MLQLTVLLTKTGTKYCVYNKEKRFMVRYLLFFSIATTGLRVTSFFIFQVLSYFLFQIAPITSCTWIVFLPKIFYHRVCNIRDGNC